MNSWMNQEWHPRVGRNKPAPMHKQYFRTMDRGILAPSYAPARQWDQPSLFGLTRGHPIKWQPFSALGDCNSNYRRGRQFQGMRAVAQGTAPDRLKVHGPGMDVSLPRPIGGTAHLQHTQDGLSARRTGSRSYLVIFGPMRSPTDRCTIALS